MTSGQCGLFPLCTELVLIRNIIFTGGGTSKCAGREFAKPEVFIVVAMIMLNFEVEFTGWRKADGSSSDRPAMNDTRYAGAVAAPPDREMAIKLRRVQ